MYSVEERAALLQKIIEFLRQQPLFEGLLLIGSGATGFSDLYSDIDLMACIFDEDAIEDADNILTRFFETDQAVHLEKRRWKKTVLGISAYFKNGLSVDLSFMPTNELPIRTTEHRILFSKSIDFEQVVAEKTAKCVSLVPANEHYRFINELRYAEIAILREQFIFADIALNNARQILLLTKVRAEQKKSHQFKAYNTLEEAFLQRLKETYALPGDQTAMVRAKAALLELYSSIAEDFDETLLSLINCFE